MCRTTPSAAAYSGVPHGAERSMPLCMRHCLKIGCSRIPNTLVTRPADGRVRGPLPPGPPGPVPSAAAARSRPAARSSTSATALSGSNRRDAATSDNGSR